jgi:hypothetical protein
LLDSKLIAGNAINRYALARPITISVDGLVALAPHLFRREPGALLVFFQRPAG